MEDEFHRLLRCQPPHLGAFNVTPPTHKQSKYNERVCSIQHGHTFIHRNYVTEFVFIYLFFSFKSQSQSKEVTSILQDTSPVQIYGRPQSVVSDLHPKLALQLTDNY